MRLYVMAAVVGLCFALPVAAAAQSPTTQPAADPSAAASTEDKSGTNPLNFQNTFIVFNEYQDLPDGHWRNITNFRYIQAFADGTMNFRLTVPLAASDLGGSPQSTTANEPAHDSDFGLGDINLRFNWVPYIDKKIGILVGVESDLDTASDDVLGRGKTTIAPIVVTAFFLSPQWIFAPAYQQKNDIAGDDDRRTINEGYLDLYVVYTAKDKRSWVIIDPTIVFDYENDAIPVTLEAEFGMIVGRLGKAAQSVYVRPGVGIGEDKPYEWNIEFGWKLIGF